MKKFLLSMATAIVAVFSTNAQQVYEIDYATDEWSFFVMGYTPEVVDGVLKSENPGGWYQYFIADQIPTVAGKNYTATIKIKASQSGVVALNMGWGWGEGEKIENSINLPTEWKEVTVNFNEVGGTSCNLVLQPGGHEGTIEIAWVKVDINDETFVIPTPEEGDVVASYYTGNDQTFGGWGTAKPEDIASVEEDGKPCLRLINEEAKDDYMIQLCINYDFTPGETYYLNFDVKGTPFKGIPSGFQGQENFANCGSLSKFNVTEEWSNVTIYGEPFNAGTEEAPNLPVRWLASVGKFVGTMYITNVRLYTKKGGSSAVEAIATEDAEPVYYNLQGLRVANPAAGQIYIVKRGSKVSKVIF